MDPTPFALCQLVVMAEAHGRDRWNHTAMLAAIIANCHSDGSRTFAPSDFHPDSQPPEPQVIESDQQLRQLLES